MTCVITFFSVLYEKYVDKTRAIDNIPPATTEHDDVSYDSSTIVNSTKTNDSLQEESPALPNEMNN